MRYTVVISALATFYFRDQYIWNSTDGPDDMERIVKANYKEAEEELTLEELWAVIDMQTVLRQISQFAYFATV